MSSGFLFDGSFFCKKMCIIKLPNSFHMTLHKKPCNFGISITNGIINGHVILGNVKEDSLKLEISVAELLMDSSKNGPLNIVIRNQGIVCHKCSVHKENNNLLHAPRHRFLPALIFRYICRGREVLHLSGEWRPN